MDRQWNRGVSKLGDQAEERSLQSELVQRYPAAEFPFHIRVVGRADGTSVGVQVYDGRGFEVIETAFPEDYLDAPEGAARVAVLDKVAEVAARLKDDGKY
jgi:hypothetical protein